jgi:hypothetical protein
MSSRSRCRPAWQSGSTLQRAADRTSGMRAEGRGGQARPDAAGARARRASLLPASSSPSAYLASSSPSYSPVILPSVAPRWCDADTGAWRPLHSSCSDEQLLYSKNCGTGASGVYLSTPSNRPRTLRPDHQVCLSNSPSSFAFLSSDVPSGTLNSIPRSSQSGSYRVVEW